MGFMAARAGFFPAIVVLSSIVAYPIPSRAATAKPVARTTRVYALGRVHGTRTFCRITRTPSPDADDCETVSVTFFSQSHDHTVSKSVSDEFGFTKYTRIQTADFIEAGHKQVFVTTAMGATSTDIFDFDGRTVRSLYEPEGGRVGVTLIPTKHHGWRLEESWGRMPYEDEFDLGTGYDKGRDGIVRSLHWNGKNFVPDRPGPTRIYDRNGRKERGPVQEYPRGHV
jgi:hypothetical protein